MNMFGVYINDDECMLVKIDSGEIVIAGSDKKQLMDLMAFSVDYNDESNTPYSDAEIEDMREIILMNLGV